MLTKVKSCAIFGLEGAIIEVEVDISPGLPAFNIVGLPDAAVQEARERVRAAIRNSGCEFPMRRITVNLAPADMKKEGPSYDLPIAVGILTSSGQLEEQANTTLYLGELSLDGSTRHTKGILPMVAMAKDEGFAQVFLPAENAKEGALVEGTTVMPVSSLAELVSHLRGDLAIEPCPMDKQLLSRDSFASFGPDISHVKGQENAKRALEVAAAGMHNLMMTGPPGSGKTLLARTMPSVLPIMDPQEALEATKVYSITGMLPSDQPLIRQRPFRSPHYTTSHAGLVGGGRTPRPGEITLAHRGVLFLDELPEFGHNALESLRQPLEDHVVTISRAQWNVTFPCNFMLLGAMNPCPCGFYGDPKKECRCSHSMVSKYQRRISGPLMDRMDMFVEVPAVEYEKLMDDSQGETSDRVQSRVEEAREVQNQRFDGMNISTNSEMGPAEVWDFCQVGQDCQKLLQASMKQLNLSARAFHRVLKLSRTIADLAGSDTIEVQHLAEALQYRPRWAV